MGLGHSGPRWAKMGCVGPMGLWDPHGYMVITGLGYVVLMAVVTSELNGPQGRVGLLGLHNGP